MPFLFLFIFIFIFENKKQHQIQLLLISTTLLSSAKCISRSRRWLTAQAKRAATRSAAPSRCCVVAPLPGIARTLCAKRRQCWSSMCVLCVDVGLFVCVCVCVCVCVKTIPLTIHSFFIFVLIAAPEPGEPDWRCDPTKAVLDGAGVFAFR